MSDVWMSIILSMVTLAVAIPYVMYIRHPTQNLLAAYLIFVTVFIISAAMLFVLVAQLTAEFELGNRLEEPGPMMIFLIVILLPALLLATWLARKPPWRQGPPP